MTHKQMWRRFRALKKNNPHARIVRLICDKEILENDSGVEYIKSGSGNDLQDL